MQKGDTLWEIAKKYGVDFDELKQANSQLSSPDMIMPGMKIKVPSTIKSVKKDIPVKEKKIEKETKEQMIKKPAPMLEGDEKEKKKEVKPQMPLPQMPQAPQIPEYPTMKMPMFEQEMKNYTMINLPQMPQTHEVKEEKPKEVPKQKETKEAKDFKEYMPPKMPEHLQIPPQPTAVPMAMEMDKHFTHMCPVCSHHYTPVPHMVEGHHYGHHPMAGYMGGQHQGHHPMQGYMPYSPMMSDCDEGTMEMPVQSMKPYDDCECGDYNYQSFYPLSSKPSIELTNNNKSMNHYPPMSHKNTGHHYPTPPHFRDKEEE